MRTLLERLKLQQQCMYGKKKGLHFMEQVTCLVSLLSEHFWATLIFNADFISNFNNNIFKDLYLEDKSC